MTEVTRGEPVYPEGAARALLSHAGRQNDGDENLVVILRDEDGCPLCGSFAHPPESCPVHEGG